MYVCVCASLINANNINGLNLQFLAHVFKSRYISLKKEKKYAVYKYK